MGWDAGRVDRKVTAWAKGEGWTVRALPRTLTEEVTGSYAASDLVIETPGGERLNVEVKGRGPADAAGRVQLSAWPSLFRVMLLHKSGQDGWTIRTDSGIPIRQDWNRETFVSVAKDLLSAER